MENELKTKAARERASIMHNYHSLDDRVSNLKDIIKGLGVEDKVEVQLITIIHCKSLKLENLDLTNPMHAKIKELKEEKEDTGFLTIF